MLQPTGRVPLPSHDEQVTLLLLGIVDNSVHLMARDNLVVGLDSLSFCLLAGFGLNRLVMPERFGLYFLDLVDGPGILRELLDDGDDLELGTTASGQINRDRHGFVGAFRAIVRHQNLAKHRPSSLPAPIKKPLLRSVLPSRGHQPCQRW